MPCPSTSRTVSLTAELIPVAVALSARPGDDLVCLNGVVVGVHTGGKAPTPTRTLPSSPEAWDAAVLGALSEGSCASQPGLCAIIGAELPEHRACVSVSLRRLVDHGKIVGTPKEPGGSRAYWWQLAPAQADPKFTPTPGASL